MNKNIEDKLATISRDTRNHRIRATQGSKTLLGQGMHPAERKQLISVNLDIDVITRLKRLAGGGSYQTLISKALAQWCDAMEFGDLLDERVERMDALMTQMEALLGAATPPASDDQS